MLRMHRHEGISVAAFALSEVILPTILLTVPK